MRNADPDNPSSKPPGREPGLSELLAAAADGRIDSLSGEQVAQLEAHLNSDAAAAASLGGVRPRDSTLVPEISMPSAKLWDGVWTAIESATSATGAVGATGGLPGSASRERLLGAARADELPVALDQTRADELPVARRRPLQRIFRLWQPFAAAAACVLMVGSWLLLKGPIRSPSAAEMVSVNTVDSLSAPDGDAVLVPDGDGWAIVLIESGGSS